MPPHRTPSHQSKAAQLPAVPKPSRMPLRDVQAAQVVLSTQLDPFLSLKALASYSGLSVRKLREHLIDPAHPLPAYRVGGKILVRGQSSTRGWQRTAGWEPLMWRVSWQTSCMNSLDSASVHLYVDEVSGGKEIQ
jgi:hypothetical protein